MQFSFFGALGSILASSGFASFAEDPRSLIMIIIACVLLYMGTVSYTHLTLPTN